MAIFRCLQFPIRLEMFLPFPGSLTRKGEVQQVCRIASSRAPSSVDLKEFWHLQYNFLGQPSFDFTLLVITVYVKKTPSLAANNILFLGLCGNCKGVLILWKFNICTLTICVNYLHMMLCFNKMLNMHKSIIL